MQGRSVLDFCLPQAVQVAVLVHCNGFVAFGNSEDCTGSVAGIQACNLIALLGLEDDHGDEVVVCHGMLDAADKTL